MKSFDRIVTLNGLDEDAVLDAQIMVAGVDAYSLVEDMGPVDAD